MVNDTSGKRNKLMKRRFIGFLTLSLLLVSCAVFQPTLTFTPPATTPNAGSDIFNTPWDDHSIYKSGLIAADQSVLNQMTTASAYHLEFKIADDIYHVTGTEDVRYTNAETSPLNEVELRLFPNILGGEMKVSNVNIDGHMVTPKYGLENSLLIVPFAKPLEPKQSIILHMDFAVTVPQSDRKSTRLNSSHGYISY